MIKVIVVICRASAGRISSPSAPPRLVLVLVAGLAVGVGFAAIGKTTRATFESARQVSPRGLTGDDDDDKTH